MPNQKISDLPAASALTGAKLAEIVQGGTNKKTTTQDIADLGAGGGGASNWGDLGGTLSDQTDLQAALDEKSDAIGTPVTGGTNYTLQASDLTLVNAGASIIIQGSGGTLTIPANATVAFPSNCFIGFRGFILVAAAGGVTATPTNSTLDCDPDFLFSLEKTGTNAWNVHNGAAGGGGGGGTWGSITGTLSSQADLDAALDAKASLTGTETLTNKRLTPRVQSVSSSATVTPNADSDDAVKITAQAANLTIANPSGTPVAMQALIIRIKDNGTARTITYGSQYRAIGVSLPATTVISKTIYLGLIWNSEDTKWDVIGYSLQQ